MSSKMSCHAGQTSSQSDTNFKELQGAVLAQQNKRILSDIKPFVVSHYQSQDELNILSNTAQQLNEH